MSTIDELLTKACGRVNEMRVADRTIPSDYGQFGSLCNRNDEAYRRLDLALRDYLAETRRILSDLDRISERDGKVDLTKCVGCSAVMNELMIFKEKPYCPPCLKEIKAKPKSKRSK